MRPDRHPLAPGRMPCPAPGGTGPPEVADTLRALPRSPARHKAVAAFAPRSPPDTGTGGARYRPAGPLPPTEPLSARGAPAPAMHSAARPLPAPPAAAAPGIAATPGPRRSGTEGRPPPGPPPCPALPCPHLGPSRLPPPRRWPRPPLHCSCRHAAPPLPAAPLGSWFAPPGPPSHWRRRAVTPPLARPPPRARWEPESRSRDSLPSAGGAGWGGKLHLPQCPARSLGTARPGAVPGPASRRPPAGRSLRPSLPHPCPPRRGSARLTWPRRRRRLPLRPAQAAHASRPSVRLVGRGAAGPARCGCGCGTGRPRAHPPPRSRGGRRDSPTMHRAPHRQHQPDITRGPSPPGRARPGPASAVRRHRAAAGSTRGRAPQRAATPQAGKQRTGVGLGPGPGIGAARRCPALGPGTGPAAAVPARSRALPGRDRCLSLRWWHQRWHRQHGPKHCAALGPRPALARSAQGRVAALLGPRPEPAHLPEAGLCIAQGPAATPLWALCWQRSQPSSADLQLFLQSSGARAKKGLVQYTALQVWPGHYTGTRTSPTGTGLDTAPLGSEHSPSILGQILPCQGWEQSQQLTAGCSTRKRLRQVSLSLHAAELGACPWTVSLP